MNLTVWKLFFSGVAAVSVLLTGGIVWLNRSPQPTVGNVSSIVISTAVTTTVTEQTETAVMGYCLLGEWNGQLATFSADGSDLWQVYNVYIKMLPPTEQTKLASGIPVENETELENLLEDYTS